MIRAASILLLAVVCSAQAAEVYRWVDPSGGVHYTDRPPTSTVKQLKTMSGKGNVVEADKESFETKLAREKSPVVLYAGECGVLCNDARAFLGQRGIPYEHKDPAKTPEHAVEVKQLTGELQVPVLLVGKTHFKEFDASSWGSMLDTAGYPKTPLIPPKP